jgi:hypothetical protein
MVESSLIFDSRFSGLNINRMQSSIWSLTLREERRMRVFENKVLRRIFGPKKDEVMGNGENYIMRR